ncbi:MAG: DNA translocase FtsK [Anaerolineae bacterium]|nr:DNA translocase FtsK [Anaerolineae bacterium]
MAQRRAREQPKESKQWWRWNLTPQAQREIWGVLFFLLGALMLLTLLRVTRGTIGDVVANVLQALFGWGAYALPLVAFGAGAFLLRRGNVGERTLAWGRIFAGEIFFALVLALLHLIAAPSDPGAFAQSGNGGGFIGWALARATAYFLGTTPSIIVLIVLCLLLIPAIVGLSAAQLRAWSDTLAERAEQPQRPAPAPAPIKLPPPAKPPVVQREPVTPPARPAPPTKPEESDESAVTAPSVRPAFGTKPPMKTSTASQTVLTPRQRARRRAPALPSLDLLDMTSEAKYGETDANRKARIIEETLANFGVPAKVVEIHAGPTVTQFGLEPGFIERRGSDGQVRARKVSVNRIAALQHDLELALAVAPIRIETPVPGKPMVGIEVPNQSVSVVSLRGVMESDVFKTKKKKNPLLIALGRDVSGAPHVADLGAMPHLLIAGATGSGKSVCINAIIACLIFNNSPDDLRLIMVDPKRVELVNFNDIPHLLGPVVVNVEEVVPCLRWLTREMDNRFTLFAKEKVRNIDAFNEKMNKTNGDTMPYIVALIDELADLMLAAPEETEKLLTRLAQMSRATGIHLVIATQRPSVDVVTGLIKANFPARISFAVTSSVDSRVVLDTLGAEKLLGRGDMLYMASDSSKLVRLQGCFVSDDEIARLVNFWRERAITDLLDIPRQAPWKDFGGEVAEGSDDELIERAIALVRQSDRTSISFLQRKLGIGYPRAARLMDQLEERGIVGPDEGGGKSRAVLIAPTTKHLGVESISRRRAARGTWLTAWWKHFPLRRKSNG